MPARERVRIRSVDLEDYPCETPKEGQGATHKLASRQLEHALDLPLSRRQPAGRYALLGDQGLYRRGRGDPKETLAPDVIVYLQAPNLKGRQSFVREAAAGSGDGDPVGECLGAGRQGKARPVRGQGPRRMLDLRPAGPSSVRGAAGAGVSGRRGAGMRKSRRRRRRARGMGAGIRVRCGAARCCRPRGDWMRGAPCACRIRRRATGIRRWPSMIASSALAAGSGTRRTGRSRNSRPSWLAAQSHALSRRGHETAGRG